MPAPTIEVLGVYALLLTPELIEEQADVLGISEDESEQQLESTVLIEVLVRGRDDRYDVGAFGQPGSDQAAYSEVYLSLDGESIIETHWPDVPALSELRVAFFMHFWDPKKALGTSYGQVKCPPVEKMPDRLAKLVPYEPVD